MTGGAHGRGYRVEDEGVGALRVHGGAAVLAAGATNGQRLGSAGAMLRPGDVLEGPVVVGPEAGLGVHGVAVGVGGQHAG